MSSELSFAAAYPSTSVGRIAEVRLGKMLQPKPNAPTDSEVHYLRAGSLEKLTGNGALRKMWASPAERTNYSVRQGDLIVAEGGDVGRSAYVPEVPDDTIIQNSLHRIRPRSGDLRFLKYALDAIYASGWLDVLCNKSTFGHLTYEKLSSLHIPWPLDDQQRAIADFLDAETARIDALIEKKRRMIKVLDERFAAHVEEKTYASVIGLAKDDPLPEDWRSVILRRCFGLIQYGIGEASRETGTVAVLGMGNVDQGEIVGNPGGFVEDIDPSLLLEPGDLLFNRTNSLALVGKVALVRASTVSTATTFASYLVRLRTNQLADSAYLNYLLNTQAILRLARSMALPSIGQANLNPSRYTSIHIPLPPVQVQHSIARELDLEATNFRRLSTALTRQIKLLTEHRQALITAAVTGQLEVSGSAAS